MLLLLLCLFLCAFLCLLSTYFVTLNFSLAICGPAGLCCSICRHINTDRYCPCLPRSRRNREDEDFADDTVRQMQMQDHKSGYPGYGVEQPGPTVPMGSYMGGKKAPYKTKNKPSSGPDLSAQHLRSPSQLSGRSGSETLYSQSQPHHLNGSYNGPSLGPESTASHSHSHSHSHSGSYNGHNPASELPSSLTPGHGPSPGMPVPDRYLQPNERH